MNMPKNELIQMVRNTIDKEIAPHLYDEALQITDVQELKKLCTRFKCLMKTYIYDADYTLKLLNDYIEYDLLNENNNKYSENI